MDPRSKEKSLNRISIMNWIGTLFLSVIPGVNIIAMFGYLFFSKAQPKRTYAAAVLILMIIVAVMICAAFLIFPDQLSQLASQLRGTVQSAPVDMSALAS